MAEAMESLARAKSGCQILIDRFTEVANSLEKIAIASELMDNQSLQVRSFHETLSSSHQEDLGSLVSNVSILFGDLKRYIEEVGRLFIDYVLIGRSYCDPDVEQPTGGETGRHCKSGDD